MPKFVVEVKGLREAERRLDQASLRLLNAADRAVETAGQVLLFAVKANVSVSPIGGSAETHAEALADLDHPYATRRGSIQLQPSGGSPGFRDRKKLVHTVSGELLRSIKGQKIPNRIGYEVSADEQQAPHARWVFEGTRAMLGRDILTATAEDPKVRRALKRVILLEMRKAFR